MILLLFMLVWPGWVERHVTIDSVTYTVGYFPDRIGCSGEYDRHSANANCATIVVPPDYPYPVYNGPYPAQIRVFRGEKWRGHPEDTIATFKGVFCRLGCDDKADDPEILV